MTKSPTHGLRATLAILAVVAGLASGQAFAAEAQVKIANFTFDPPTSTAGTIEYFCAIHPHMTGKIVVTP